MDKIHSNECLQHTCLTGDSSIREKPSELHAHLLRTTLPFALSEREESTEEQQGENRGGTRDNLAPNTPEPRPDRNQASPTGGREKAEYGYMTMQFRTNLQLILGKFAMLSWDARQCINTYKSIHENATSENLRCFKIAKLAMLS